MRVLMKMRVLRANPAHTTVGVFDRVDGEGDVPSTDWTNAGQLVFRTELWPSIAVAFEAADIPVEDLRDG